MKTAVEPISKFYVSQGLKLHYLDWGNASAPPLILVHGMQDHARSWDWVARALRDQWHVIVPDLRGHGDSDWSPDGAYHTPYLLLDLAQLITELGDSPVSIIAHSLGGNPSARYAGLFPDQVKQLVLVDAMGPTAPAIESWDKQGIVNRTRDWLQRRTDLDARPTRYFDTIDAAIARMRKAHQYLSAEQAEHLTRHGLRSSEQGWSWKYDPRAGAFHPEDFAIHLSEYWREITAPTLICWGPGSWTTNPAKDGNADFFRNHQTLTFEHAGHWIHHDQLEEFVEAVQRFLINKHS